MYSPKNDDVAVLLPVGWVVHTFVQYMPFCRQAIFTPLLFDMYQRPLPGTEHVVLYPRQHEHLVIVVHHGLFCLFRFFSLKRQRTKETVEVALEQAVLHDAVLFELRLGMLHGLLVAHAPGIVEDWSLVA